MVPALSVVVSLALGATVSSSRLGVVVNGPGTSAANVVAACPRAVKAAQPLASATSGTLLASYRVQCSGGTGILELPATTLRPVAGTFFEGQTDASSYWAVNASVAFSGVTPGDVRWVAGPPNLFDLGVANPNASATNAEYAKGFVSQLATLVQAQATSSGVTYALLLPPWSSTTPGTFCDVVHAALSADPGIGWAWRGTSAALSSVVADEAQTTFGYRAVRDTCALSGTPIFSELSAAGGWFSNGRTPTQVLTFLKFVDSTSASDTEVSNKGAILLRSLGSGDVDDLSPAAADLATYLKNPTPSGGTDGTSSGGVNNGPHVGGGSGGGLSPSAGHSGGCGNAADGLALLSLAALAPVVLRRRRVR